MSTFLTHHFFRSSITTSLLSHGFFFVRSIFGPSVLSITSRNGECKFKKQRTISSIHSSSISRATSFLLAVPMNWTTTEHNQFNLRKPIAQSTDSRRRDSHFMFHISFFSILFLTLTKITLIDANERTNINFAVISFRSLFLAHSLSVHHIIIISHFTSVFFPFLRHNDCVAVQRTPETQTSKVEIPLTVEMKWNGEKWQRAKRWRRKASEEKSQNERRTWNQRRHEGDDDLTWRRSMWV